jgi:hypothetical protein
LIKKMSDGAYQQYIDNINEALASIDINAKLIRQNIANLLIGTDEIHPNLYVTIPKAELQNIGTPENRFDFIIDILDNHMNYPDLSIKSYHNLDEVSAIGSLTEEKFVDKLMKVAEFADEIFVDHKAYQLEEFNDLPVYLKQFALHLSEYIGNTVTFKKVLDQEDLDVIPQLIAEYGIDEAELSKEFLDDIESVYTRTDGVDMTTEFFIKYQGKGANAAMIFPSAVNDTLRVPIELSRQFVGESQFNRQTLELHSALQDPVHGPYIEKLLDEIEYSPVGRKDIAGSFSDTVDLLSDNAWYGIKNTTNRYVEAFRNNLINYINGNVTGAYNPDFDTSSLHNIMEGLEQAYKDFSTTVQSISAGYEVPYAEDLIEALDTDVGKNLLNTMDVGSSLDAKSYLHQWLQSPGEPLAQSYNDIGFVLSDNALRATGAVSPEFVEKMFELRKATPGLVPEVQQTIQEMTNMLKPTIDNAFSVFEIQPPAGEIFHIRPLKEFLNYTNANKNVDVKFYNFNTSKFENMGILGIVKSGVNNTAPDTLIIEVTPKKIDMIEDVIDFVGNLPETAGTKPEIKKLIAETPEDIAEYVDKSKLPDVENVLKDPKIGKAISSTAMDFAKKAGKFSFGGAMTALAPGDVIIETGIRKLLPRLGLAAISAPALAAYTAYELALLAADVGKGLATAKNTDDGDSFGRNFWEGFQEAGYSDKYSIGYKLTKEIHNSLFEDVYGRIAQDLYAGTDS